MRQQITFVEFDNFKLEMVVGWKILGKGRFAIVSEGTFGETKAPVCPEKVNLSNAIRLLHTESDIYFRYFLLVGANLNATTYWHCTGRKFQVFKRNTFVEYHL